MIIMEKTNVMRILEQKKVCYTPHTYDDTITDGVKVAEAVGEPQEQVFKTLVTVANTGTNYVFCVPVAEKLDLRKAAKAVGVKNVEMIKQKELLPLTGYIHGGCSPIGMKKKFVTVIDETAVLYETIFVSAGRVGYQIEIEPNTLIELVDAKLSDIIVL